MTSTVKKSYIHVIVMMVLTFGIGFLPPFGMITPSGMKVLGVFIGLVYGWCFIDLFWPSIFGFFAIAVMGVTSATELLQTGFSHVTVITLIVLCGFAGCLNKLGVSQAMAYWIMSRKIFMGRPWLLAAGMVFSAMIFGLIGGSYASIFLLWGIVDTIIKSNNIEKGELFFSLIYALVVVSVITSGGAAPYLPGFLVWGGFANGVISLEPALGNYFILGMIHIIISLILCILVGKYVLRGDGSKFLLTEEMRKEYAQQKIDNTQKLGLILLAVFLLMVIMPSFLPAGSLKNILSVIGLPGAAIAYMCVFAILKKEDGTPACDLIAAFRDEMAWQMIALVAITIPLGNMMSGQDFGVSATLGAYCSALFGDIDGIAMVIISVIVLGLSTQVMHNLILGAIFMPILIPLGVSMGVNPYTFFFVLRIALVTAYMTPAASINAGMIFGRGDIPAKHSLLIGTVLFVVMNAVALCMIPLCNMMFANLV